MATGPVLLPDNILTFRVWCTEAEQASVNTFHYYVESGIVGAFDLEDAAIAFDTVVAPSYKIILNNQATYNGVEAYVNQLPQPLPQSYNGSAGAGTGGAVAMSRQTAGITRWNTVLAGPQYRGRSYWPFPSTGEDAAGGVPTTGYLTAIGNLSQALINLVLLTNSIRSAPVAFVLKHGINKAGLVPPPTNIVQYTAIAKWATQKRRGSYGRVNASPI